MLTLITWWIIFKCHGPWWAYLVALLILNPEPRNSNS